MLLVGQQEGNPACKNMGGWWRQAPVSPDGVAPRGMVGVSASVNFPLHHKVQFPFPLTLGGSGKKAVKRSCVCCDTEGIWHKNGSMMEVGR